MSDVIVVGGGPAGSALAIMLGRQGLEVELYDQGHFPRDKPCGEGLMPMGVDVLGGLGLKPGVSGRRFRGVCYHVGDTSVRGGFGGENSGERRYGLAQRRLYLDAHLWQAARSTPGVVAREQAYVEAPLVEHGRVAGVLVGGETRRAGQVIAADGSMSSIRRRLGLIRPLSPRRMGIRSHYRCAPGQVLPDHVQIFVRRGYELYVTPLPHREMLVAALAHDQAYDGSLSKAYRLWIEREALLCSWLDGAKQVSELAGRGPLSCDTLQRACPPGLILVGDAATSVDPVTAGGLSLALLSAELLAGELPEILRGSLRARQRFEAARARATRVHRLLGTALLRLGSHPEAARYVCRFMQTYPALMRMLVRLASERWRR